MVSLKKTSTNMRKMSVFRIDSNAKYHLLENPKKRCFIHAWVLFGLILLSLCFAVIALVLIFHELRGLERQRDALDYVLFGPKKGISDALKVAEYRALTYAAAYNVSKETNQLNFENVRFGEEFGETYRHVDKNYSLVCYYNIPDVKASDPLYASRIDAKLCTHIIIFFATIRDCQIHYGSYESQIYDAVVKLKLLNPALKVMLSVAAMGTSFDSFADMVSSKSNRKVFIRSLANVTKVHNIDGIDFDWEFPAWPPSRNSTQKDQLTDLVQEVRSEFGPEFIISVAVAAPFVIAERSYDIPKLALFVDFVNVMCYDYHSFVLYWPFVGPNSPLYPSYVDTASSIQYWKTLTVNYTTHFWIDKGMPKEKIMIGVPTYGHSWLLLDAKSHDFGSLAAGFGFLGEKGFVSFGDVCVFCAKGADVVFDGNTRTPYAFKGREWISFESELSMSYKAEYIAGMGLGGAMIYSLNNDDYSGTLCNGTTWFPLTSTVKKVFDRFGI